MHFASIFIPALFADARAKAIAPASVNEGARKAHEGRAKIARWRGLRAWIWHWLCIAFFSPRTQARAVTPRYGRCAACLNSCPSAHQRLSAAG